MDSNNNITAGGPPIWRKALYTTLAILTFLYLTITTVLFYIRRRKISDIRYRPLRLNILNVIAATTLCVMFCMRTAFYPNQYPCVLVNWPAYIGFFLYCSSISCRVLSFSWIAKYNLAKLRISVAYTPLQASFNLSNVSNFSKISSKNSKNNYHINSPISPGINESLDFPGAKLMYRLKKFKQFTTDKWLAYWIICPTMILALILALVEQLTSPSLSIIPLSTACSNNGPPTQYIPIYILNGSFIFIICPSLIYLIYDLKDAYGLRNELMVNLISGAISYILYFIIETFFTSWKNYIGSLMFGWITFVLCHTLSITIPLIQSYKPKVYFVPVTSTSEKISAIKRSLSTRKNNNNGDGKSKRYLMFEKVLEDHELFERYKACAAACFCTELIIFLQEYQFLKTLVVYSCTPSNKEILPPSTPNIHVTEAGHISFPENPNLLDPSPTVVSPSFTTTPCTKSIVETVSAATWIPMPLELRTDYNTFYETFFNSDSDLAINFPGSLLNDVKDKVIKGKYELIMYEQAREEVLNLLYRNTFERYLKMYSSDVERKGIHSSICFKV